MQHTKTLTALVFATLVALSGQTLAQGWDPTAKEFNKAPTAPRDPDSGGGAASVTPAQRNASLDQLNKILALPQLPIQDRLLALNVRAFQYSKLGRETDSLKDVVEMAKVLPQAWHVVLSGQTAGLAGGGDRATALRVIGHGLTRKPGDTSLTIGQAEIHMQIAEHAQALGLLNQAVGGASTAGERQYSLLMRGLANFNVGNFPQAVDDFDGSLAGRTTLKSRLNPTLWRYAAHVRARRDAKAALAKDIGNENLYEWPGPIAKFLLGQISAGELEVASESDPVAKQVNGKCATSFFVGMDAVRRGDKQRAREQFQLAQARCSTVINFNWAASSELKRL